MDAIRILLAILLPPLGVFLQVGLGFHFWLNIVLTLFGYVPGLVHAIWVIATLPEAPRPPSGARFDAGPGRPPFDHLIKD